MLHLMCCTEVIAVAVTALLTRGLYCTGCELKAALALR